jgi:hypothetical protein
MKSFAKTCLVALAALLLMCGGKENSGSSNGEGDGGTSGSLDPKAPIASLTLDQREAFCDWEANLFGGYNRTAFCDAGAPPPSDGGFVDSAFGPNTPGPVDRASCAMALPSYFVKCTTIVEEAQTCISWSLAALCNAMPEPDVCKTQFGSSCENI